MTMVKCEYLSGEGSDMPEEQACTFTGLYSYEEFNKYSFRESHNFWDDRREKKEKKVAIRIIKKYMHGWRNYLTFNYLTFRLFLIHNL